MNQVATFQKLTKAGRAGRQERDSLIVEIPPVLVYTLTTGWAISAA
jgi:hypothetical protein